MIAALEKNIGVVTPAAIAAGIDRSTHYEWLKTDPDYKHAVETLDNLSLDFSESKLYKNIAAGDTTAIIFHLKTKGKKRGYIERVQFGVGDDDEEIESTLSI